MKPSDAIKEPANREEFRNWLDQQTKRGSEFVEMLRRKLEEQGMAGQMDAANPLSRGIALYCTPTVAEFIRTLPEVATIERDAPESAV